MQVLKVRQNLPITPRRPGDPECSSFPHFRKVVRIPKRLKNPQKTTSDSYQARRPVGPDTDPNCLQGHKRAVLVPKPAWQELPSPSSLIQAAVRS